MKTISQFITNYNYIIVIINVILIVSVILNINNNKKKIARLKKRYDNILRGKGEMNLEEVLIYQGGELEELKQRIDDMALIQKSLNKKATFSIQKIGFYKYNAFPDLTNELSYTLVLLDSFNTGVMITSIFGRESSVGYAKKIVQGNSKLELSKEEEIALGKALDFNYTGEI